MLTIPEINRINALLPGEHTTLDGKQLECHEKTMSISRLKVWPSDRGRRLFLLGCGNKNAYSKKECHNADHQFAIGEPPMLV